MADEISIDFRRVVTKGVVDDDTQLSQRTVDMAGDFVATVYVEATTSNAQVEFPDSIGSTIDVAIYNEGTATVSFYKDSGDTHLLSAVKAGGLAFLTGIPSATVYCTAASGTQSVRLEVNES